MSIYNMEFVMDKILTCKQCHSQFYFTEKEQSFYKKKGFNIPKLCPSCRKKNKQPKQHTPRACRTCYFRDCKYGFDAITSRRTYQYYCRRSGKNLINDAPCKHWSKKTS